VATRRWRTHAAGRHDARRSAPPRARRRAHGRELAALRERAPLANPFAARAERPPALVRGAFAGVVLLSIALFWLFRQCRNPKIRVKDRWWMVEALLGSTVFIMMLYNNPGFWYAR
jgi:hypothetical protein